MMKTQLIWAVHNLFAHPVSEICWWLGYVVPAARKFGDWIHDYTIPEHIAGEGRG